MAEKRIEIVGEENNIVTYDEIVRDTVNREEVAKAEELIAEIEKEIADKSIELEQLKERVAKAKQILALADEKKLKEVEAIETEPIDLAENIVLQENI